jgi:hypothetical protein
MISCWLARSVAHPEVVTCVYGVLPERHGQRVTEVLG